ncbi:MAG TPA: hypothetical protein VGC66_09820 [Pyrinomonadaceae bacterium]|jgi:hypothetical protein
MFRRTLAVMLSAILLSTVFGIQAGHAQTGKDSEAERTRAKVQKMGVGAEARVEVRLRDKTKLKGYISAAGGDSFTVTDSKTGTTQTLAYTDVTEVKKPGGGLSTRTLIILGAVVATVVIIGVTVIKPVVCDGGAGC